MNHPTVPELMELIRKHASLRPDAPAVTHLRPGKPPVSWSWAELLEQAECARRALDRQWPKSGIVAAYAGKSLGIVALMVGAMSSGRTFAGINSKFRGPQVRQVLKSCQTSAAFVDSAALQVIREVVDEAPDELTQCCWIDAQHASPVARTASETLMKTGLLQPWLPADVGSQGEDPGPSCGALPIERPAACLFTSGSTGVPKGVLVSWADLWLRAQAECELFDLSSQDVLLSVLPFSFDVGLNQLLSSWVSGAHLVMLDSWTSADILTAVERHRVTGISGVPSIWLSLVRSPLEVDLTDRHRSWRYLTVSGGSMSTSQMQALASRVEGVGIYKTYGQTESFRSTALAPKDLKAHAASVGKAFGSAKVYVVRDDGSLAAPNEPGEVVHTGLGVMLGYLNAPPGSEKRRPNPFLGPDDASAFAIFTGDQGYLDDEGFLYLAGRHDDLVKIAGNRVHLAEVAMQASMLPSVLAAEAVVVRTHDDDPSIMLFVLPHAHAADLQAEQLKLDLSKRLPSYMHPKRVEVLLDFPLTASGKADRALLKQLAAQALQGGESQGEAQSPNPLRPLTALSQTAFS